jgi:hypothetical protein
VTTGKPCRPPPIWLWPAGTGLADPRSCRRHLTEEERAALAPFDAESAARSAEFAAQYDEWWLGLINSDPACWSWPLRKELHQAVHAWNLHHQEGDHHAMSLKEDFENLIPDVEKHLRDFIDGHSAVIERGFKLIEMADADPLMQTVEAAAGLTPGARAAIAEAIAKLDVEFQRVAAEATENGRQAERNAQAAAQPPAEPEAPAE